MDKNSEPIYLTPEGFQKRKKELDYLRTVRRQEVALRLHNALQEGDILENAELEDAKNEQAFLEGRIMALEQLLYKAIIIQEEGPRDTVGVGSRVTVVEGSGPPETYHVVGSAEADPTQGMISNESPLGRALMGRKIGDTAEVNAPDGVLAFKIVGIA
ncbi:MAG TPA: transcription elongation factor GreA [Chloroflexi bacterium]|nr:transcription elongation factor GreA [Chloroflexota bacterium]